jgi:hypothetical protein
MNTITVDTSLQESLVGLSGLTQVCDEQGAVIGYFSPASHASPEAYAQAAAHFDPHEMKDRKRSQERGRSTSEILNRIESLDK